MMRRMLAAVAGTMLLAGAAGSWAEADAPGTEEWGDLAAANNLDVKGNTPFHLGMTFQLYDLSGKPTESGSFETWWTGSGPRRTVVHLTGLNENGSSSDEANAATVRYSYLVSQLIESAIHPVPSVLLPAEMVTRTLKSGKLQLDCTGPKPSPVEAFNAQPATVCVAPNTSDVLVLQGLGGNLSMLRPKTGKFRDTFMALDLRILYLGKDAIAGTVTMMQAYDAPTLDQEPPANSNSDPSVARLSGGVIAGHRVKFAEPAYPMLAKASHSSGVVLLRALIGKDGAIRRLVAIASTDAMFTESATEAVRQWRYSPYLLNGEPTDVDTTITVNFAIN